MREKSRTVDNDIPTFRFFWNVEWDALYSDAPLNLLMTSCRSRSPIYRDKDYGQRWPFRQIPKRERRQNMIDCPAPQYYLCGQRPRSTVQNNECGVPKSGGPVKREMSHSDRIG